MEIVVDVNVVLSSLLTKGDSFKVFVLNFVFDRFNFVAPGFLLAELNKYKDEIFKRSRLSKEEFDEILEFVLEQITFIPESEFPEHLPKAKQTLSNHLKDVQYLALALKLNCPIFSGDKVLRELLSDFPIEILPPKEMLSKL